MTTATPSTVEQSQRHQYASPRPGRSYCDAVWSYECLAPAGFRSGLGVGSCPGVRRSDLHTCRYCGEPVCENCSSDHDGLGRVCDSHQPEELPGWVQPDAAGAGR